MARKAKSRSTPRKGSRRKASGRGQARPLLRRILHNLVRAFLGVLAVVVFAVTLHGVLRPWPGLYMTREHLRLGEIRRDWVPMDQIAPAMARSVVAAEDANFCLHWGVDMTALRQAIASGGERGGSTLTQQVVKNVYLWHGRSYVRKALEAMLTPLVELTWSKRRILEVYLNVAEFDEGVFGVEAAAQHYFGTSAKDLTATQAARLASVLPSPKTRSASRPTEYLQRRSAAIRDGAATISADGRATCFED
ncbi:monofunctional biosynthetic peptidoglycan transglycosylase [Oceanicola sp. S124]|uniref:monofunctional biosynthetic peptidoglycan transglycosylase n=1 Tax=Oceanicola sp. S124 TaxID=1042378 RepID=UPI0002559674|nr:monofunctional biosynthetic peptidoglycan transglycosylase [Oceanicola sp. S124]